MMKKSTLHLLYIIILFIFPTTLLAQSAKEKIRIHGKTIDSSTKEVIPYASARIKDTQNGSISDNKGVFSFESPIVHDTLIVSCLGYTDAHIAITPKTKMPLKVLLTPADYDLPEVVVKPGREKYSKKPSYFRKTVFSWSECRDSNSGPLEPHSSAIPNFATPGYCAVS